MHFSCCFCIVLLVVAQIVGDITISATRWMCSYRSVLPSARLLLWCCLERAVFRWATNALPLSNCPVCSRNQFFWLRPSCECAVDIPHHQVSSLERAELLHNRLYFCFGFKQKSAFISKLSFSTTLYYSIFFL